MDTWMDIDVIHVSDSFYAIVYDGKITTVNISNDGMNVSLVDEDNILILQSSGVNSVDILHVKERTYAVALDYNTIGKLFTLRIGKNGELANSIDNFLFFGDTNGVSLVHSPGASYGIITSNEDADCYITTMNISFTETSRLIIGKKRMGFLDDFCYRLWANGSHVFGSICNESIVEKTLSVSLGSGWNYIILTYNETSGMNLTRKTVSDESYAHTNWFGLVRISTMELEIGRYNCIMDEVAIYNKALSYQDILNNFNRQPLS
jgi:hypothetical protein